MTARQITLRARRLFHRSRILQLGLVFAFWYAGVVIVGKTGLPLPAGVVGLGFALLALAAGSLKVRSLKRGADWLLADMLLFFIPAVLGILDHREFLGLLGVKLFGIIVLSTLAVMASTAVTIDLFYRRRTADAGSAPSN